MLWPLYSPGLVVACSLLFMACRGPHTLADLTDALAEGCGVIEVRFWLATCQKLAI